MPEISIVKKRNTNGTHLQVDQ